MQSEVTESSVLVSLRELAALEGERVQQEERDRRRAQAEAAQQRELQAAERHAAEQARVLAEQQRRETLARQAAEEAARLRAIKDAELERARVQAQAQAQREVVAAQQHHEREMLSLSQARDGKRLKRFAWGALLLTAMAGAGATVGWLNYNAEQQDLRAATTARVERERRALAMGRLADLDRMRAPLVEQTQQLEQPPAEVSSALGAVRQARSRLSEDNVSDRDLDDYARSLSALAAQLPRAHRLQRRAALVAVHDKMLKQLDAIRRPDKALTQAAKRAAEQRAALAPDHPADSALRDYRTAVEALGAALPDSPDKPRLQPHRWVKTPPTELTTKVCPKGDPLCSDLPGVN